MEVVKVDSQGRFYLPKAIRKAAGIEGETVLEIMASRGQIILKVREESVAKAGRGAFKIKGRIEDVDRKVRERALQKVLGELDEIRRR